MPRFLDTTMSWALRLGVLIGLSSSADARFIPLVDPPDFPTLSAVSIRPVKAVQSLNSMTSWQPQEDEFPQNKVQLVQMRQPPNQGNRLDDSSVPDIHEDYQESACAKKIRTMFPAVVFPSSALALDQARVDHKEQTVVIPLKEPHEEIRAIWFDTSNITEALDMIRLLHTGKLGAVSVSPLARRPSTFYMFRGVTKEERAACRPERVLELLGKCTECEVLEWQSLKP